MHINWMRQVRQRLARTESLLHFSVLGIIAGFTCGLIMLLFHYLITALPGLWLPGGGAENFEDLASWQHFALPVGGAILVGLILSRLPQTATRCGVPYVITRVHGHHGHIPLTNSLVQFFVGAFAISTGQSGGREGPSVHLGAGLNSVIGQRLLLPNNSIRVLAGCGTAAAIAAAFNTPIAGVIFAMEVVMMEYTIAGFIPVMLATVTATAITQAAGIDTGMFNNAVTELKSLWELPYIALLGLVVGSCAALFITILKAGARRADKPVFWRMLIAGIVTGCCAVLVPEIMGLGYDTMTQAVSGNITLQLLMAVIAGKLLATAVSCGLGMPIGLIGPNLLIGACIGSIFGALATAVVPGLEMERSLYALLGMGAMMGAVLNAPLAALMALIELTDSTTIILPGMLVITVATLTNSEIFHQQSATQTVLTAWRAVLRTDPLTLALQRTSVAAIMDRNIEHLPRFIDQEQAELLLKKAPATTVISDNEKVLLADWQHIEPSLQAAMINHQGPAIDLLTLTEKSNYHAATNLHIQATLREAVDVMNQAGVDAVFVSGYISGPYPDQGVVRRYHIEQQAAKPQ